MRERERHIGPRQREAPHPFVDVSELGALRAQEFAPGRRVVEEIVHLDCGADRVRGGTRSVQFAVVGLDLPRGIRIGRARRQRDPRDRADTWQRLAAEAERNDRLEVLEARDLAGRVA